MHWWVWLITGILVLTVSFGIYTMSVLHTLETKQLTVDLHGLGGNVAVLNTDEGTVIVDSMTFQLQGERIIRARTDVCPLNRPF